LQAQSFLALVFVYQQYQEATAEDEAEFDDEEEEYQDIA
jgi:hypothetical protein